MKKWERAEISCLDLSATEHQWKFSWEKDGGYLGDGEITGWFGPDPAPTPAPSPAPIPTPTVTPAEDNNTSPADIAIDKLS
ncbi:hypothetical protein [Butyrivibrio sp. XBB1001]|uniref:hypothetical protein n=1 Tax=Butyrivibrio sp. XBB1001 TaxID=1280682 RepID=UPI000408F359|nr:hypothetical protein [Butyrivibrio sp. XBB1001]